MMDQPGKRYFYLFEGSYANEEDAYVRQARAGEVKRQLTLWCEESPDNSSDQDRD